MRLVAHDDRVGEATAKLQRSSCGCSRRLNGLWSYTVAERKLGGYGTLSLTQCFANVVRHHAVNVDEFAQARFADAEFFRPVVEFVFLVDIERSRSAWPRFERSPAWGDPGGLDATTAAQVGKAGSKP
jgi:hypothetical protein